jgi:hypothetical protein
LDKHSVLAVAGALAAPTGWITTKTKLALLTTKGVSGTAIHVDTVLGRIILPVRCIPFKG